MRNHCTTRTVLGILNKDGTYQERLTLPAANLHVVPDNVSTENAAFAEPLAAAFRIPEQQLISHGDKIAIVGDVREAATITSARMGIVNIGSMIEILFQANRSLENGHSNCVPYDVHVSSKPCVAYPNVQ